MVVLPQRGYRIKPSSCSSSPTQASTWSWSSSATARGSRISITIRLTFSQETSGRNRARSVLGLELKLELERTGGKGRRRVFVSCLTVLLTRAWNPRVSCSRRRLKSCQAWSFSLIQLKRVPVLEIVIMYSCLFCKISNHVHHVDVCWTTTKIPAYCTAARW